MPMVKLAVWITLVDALGMALQALRKKMRSLVSVENGASQASLNVTSGVCRIRLWKSGRGLCFRMAKGMSGVSMAVMVVFRTRIWGVQAGCGTNNAGDWDGG